MENAFIFRNRTFSSADVALVRQVIVEYPEEGRCALSRRLCLAWNWTQPNGQPKDMICRGLLLDLERKGAIRLPPMKKVPFKNPFLHRSSPKKIEIDKSPIEKHLRELFPIAIHQVRRSPLEELCNSLIEEHHYLGYAQPVGEHLKYMVLSGDRPVACLVFSSAAWHLGPRDHFIGWTPVLREKNRHLLAYNSRFLIMPWVRVPHLASHLLAQCLKRLSKDWQTLYSHPVHWVETFVDSERFKGTCYQAANWIFLGNTTGRGKFDQTRKPNRSIKDVYGYPLVRQFRERLTNG
jgi:Druantia protein DruA